MHTHSLCFEQKCEKCHSFFSENFQFLEVKFSVYLNRRILAKGKTMLAKQPCCIQTKCIDLIEK